MISDNACIFEWSENFLYAHSAYFGNLHLSHSSNAHAELPSASGICTCGCTEPPERLLCLFIEVRVD